MKKTATLMLSPIQARRLAITRQRLAGPPAQNDPPGILNLVRDLGCLQLDPTSAVARSHWLVLWSRLGQFDLGHLDTLLWGERSLFEYWAHAASIVLTEDYPIHYDLMQRYGVGDERWYKRLREWMETNADLRDHILTELERNGPLSSKDFEDKSQAAWHSKGWTSGRNVSRMLDFLWTQGKILVKERRGQTRYWDLADRCLPDWTPREPLETREVVRRAAQKALRALGVGTIRHIKQHYIRDRYHDLEAVLADLRAEGLVQPVQIVDQGKAWPGEWFIHRDDVSLLGSLDDGVWVPRTTLLSPFDNLICDRARAEKLFNFDFRIEIYVPKDQRQYGYFVMPILHGDRLIGRVDPLMNRKEKRLHINAVYAEPDAPQDKATGRAVAGAIRDLGAFLGATDIAYTERAPTGWQTALR